jgi:hypothetical protein
MQMKSRDITKSNTLIVLPFVRALYIVYGLDHYHELYHGSGLTNYAEDGKIAKLSNDTQKEIHCG